MTDNQKDKYIFYTKVAWAIYTLVTITVIAILVLFVARDTEERFFYTIMPAAAAYVFRPTNGYLSKLVFRFTGVSQSSDSE